MLFAPAPTVGVLLALHSPQGSMGVILWAMAKIWLFALPALWYLWIEKQAFSLSKPQNGGITMGFAVGNTNSQCVKEPQWNARGGCGQGQAVSAFKKVWAAGLEGSSSLGPQVSTHIYFRAGETGRRIKQEKVSSGEAERVTRGGRKALCAVTAQSPLPLPTWPLIPFRLETKGWVTGMQTTKLHHEKNTVTSSLHRLTGKSGYS